MPAARTCSRNRPQHRVKLHLHRPLCPYYSTNARRMQTVDFPPAIGYNKSRNEPEGIVFYGILFGSATSQTLKMPDVTQDDVSKLTHINLRLGPHQGRPARHAPAHKHRLSEQFRRWNPAVKIVLSVGGWGAGGFSTMAMTDAGRRAFAASCLDYVNAHGLDGIDIDWGVPLQRFGRHRRRPARQENYTALLQALRDALGQNRIVSLAAGAATTSCATPKWIKWRRSSITSSS